MRAASYAVSWVIGLIRTVVVLIILIVGRTVAQTYYYYDYYYGGTKPYVVYTRVAYPAWVWLLFIIFIVIRLVLLIIRPMWINSGSRVGVGLATLVFVSVLGGIFTFCIPMDKTIEISDLDYYKNKALAEEINKGKESENKIEQVKDNADLIAKYKKLYDDGAITLEEYEQKKKQLLDL